MRLFSVYLFTRSFGFIVRTFLTHCILIFCSSKKQWIYMRKTRAAVEKERWKYAITILRENTNNLRIMKIMKEWTKRRRDNTKQPRRKRMNAKKRKRKKWLFGCWFIWKLCISHTSCEAKKEINKLQPPTNGFKVHICIEIMNADKYMTEHTHTHTECEIKQASKHRKGKENVSIHLNWSGFFCFFTSHHSICIAWFHLKWQRKLFSA